MVLVGVGFAVVGVLLWTGVGKTWLGQLPGDVRYSKGPVTFYFPVVTCLLLSGLLTLLVWLFRR